jgi:two-component system sensor histidine kinase PilS (NtrC family)
MAQINALITDEMHDGVLVVNQAFQVKHYNHQAKSLLGLEKDQWQDKLLNEISPEIANLMQLWAEETAASSGFEPTSPATPNFLKLTALSRELRLRFLPIANKERSFLFQIGRKCKHKHTK